MTLRLKLALGFGGLLLLVLLVGGYSISLLSRLGPAIDTILRENYESIAACHTMQDALHRIDSGLQHALQNRRDDAMPLVKEGEQLFRDGLAREYRAVYVPGEGEAAKEIERLFSEYIIKIRNLSDGSLPHSVITDEEAMNLSALGNEISRNIGVIWSLNEQKMLSADRTARDMAVQGTRTMAILLVVGVLLAVGTTHVVVRSILRPIHDLTTSTMEIAAGNLDLEVQPRTRDELGSLADAFNTMASHLRDYRKSDHERLVRVQNTTQMAIDSLQDPVILVTPAGIVEIANRAAKELLGVTVGTAAVDEKRPWMNEVLDDAVAQRTQVRGYESAIQVFSKGEERFFLPRGVAVRNEEGQSAGTMVILAEITTLRQIDDLKSDLLATISHEVNSPLTGLRMALYLLANDKGGALSDRQKEVLGSATEEADRLSRITSSLLGLASFESSRVGFDLQPVKPEAIVNSGLSGMRQAFAAKGVDLFVDVSPDVPTVMADPVRLNLVMTNLLSNALKYTPSGGKVTIAAKDHGDVVSFYVQDTGIGIPEESIPRVFEKYYRVPSKDKVPQGAGLGLAIAREIVTAHQGSIRCHSREGGGTTFVVALPVATKRDSAQT